MAVTHGESDLDIEASELDSALDIPGISDASPNAFYRRLSHVSIAEWRILRYAWTEHYGIVRLSELEADRTELRIGSPQLIHGRCQSLHASTFVNYIQETENPRIEIFPWSKRLITEGLDAAVEEWTVPRLDDSYSP